LKGRSPFFKISSPLSLRCIIKVSSREAKPLLHIPPPFPFKERGIKGVRFKKYTMSKPRNYQTEAIIIKKTKLGEADRILTLYTPHLGKIQAVAKGVRRPRSKPGLAGKGQKPGHRHRQPDDKQFPPPEERPVADLLRPLCHRAYQPVHRRTYREPAPVPVAAGNDGAALPGRRQGTGVALL